jgi:hypothetical protein
MGWTPRRLPIWYATKASRYGRLSHNNVTANIVRPLSAKPHAIPSQKLATPSEPRRRPIVAIAAGTIAIQSKATLVKSLALFSGESRGQPTTPCHIGTRRAPLWKADGGLAFMPISGVSTIQQYGSFPMLLE